MATDLTTEILNGIRYGVLQLGQRLDQTNARLYQTNARLERVEHGRDDFGKFMCQVALDQAKHEHFHTQHAARLDSDVSVLQKRVLRLEAQSAG